MIPNRAPRREPFFQNIPPIIAGVNCAMATKEIKPMETNENWAEIYL